MLWFPVRDLFLYMGIGEFRLPEFKKLTDYNFILEYMEKYSELIDLKALLFSGGLGGEKFLLI